MDQGSRNARLIIMAGLPGSGKSAVARGLAARIGAAVIDKDVVRAALFPPDHVEYSSAQDDFVVRLMLQAAQYLQSRGTAVILDGRTYCRRYQIDAVIRFAQSIDAPFRIVECVCRDETALARITREMGTHLARNRTPALYRAQREAWEGIPVPKLIVDTDRPLEQCVEQAAAYVQQAI